MEGMCVCPLQKPLLLSQIVCGDGVSLAWDVIRNSREMAMSAIGIMLVHLQERGQNLKIGASHVCTDESSVYGLDKGATGAECKWHWRRSTWQAPFCFSVYDPAVFPSWRT